MNSTKSARRSIQNGIMRKVSGLDTTIHTCTLTFTCIYYSKDSTGLSNKAMSCHERAFKLNQSVWNKNSFDSNQFWIKIV